MDSNVRIYRLDFSPDATASERIEMCELIEKSGAMISAKFNTQRSGPFGLEYSHQIEYAQITVMSNHEKAYMHKVISDNAIFSKSILTQVS